MKIRFRKTYSYYDYPLEEREEMLKMYNTYFLDNFGEGKIKGKDYAKVDKVEITVVSVNNKGIVGETAVGQSVFIDLRKEVRNMLKLGYPEPEIGVGDTMEVIVTRDLRGNYMGSLSASYESSLKDELYKAITSNSHAYNVKIEEICPGGFMVNLSGIKCFLPGSLAATNRIFDFGEYLGKTVTVMVETYDEERGIFVVSFKKYLRNIISSRVEELKIGEKYSGVVTGTSAQGVFLEWNEIFTGMIHIAEFEGDTNKYNPGDQLDFYVIDTKNTQRLGLSLNPPSQKIVNLQDLKTQSQAEDSFVYAKECKVAKIKGSGLILKIEEMDQSAFIDKRDLTRSIREYKVGDTITCYPISVNVSEAKISMRQFEKNI